MIKDFYESGKTIYSIEVFPPKPTDDITTIYDALDEFKKFNPSFISVTYGAGGGTSKNTVAIASYIKNTCNIEALAHLTCASLKSEEMLKDFIFELRKNQIHNVLALRGDKPKDMSTIQFENRYYKYAADLAARIQKENNKDQFFTIAGACYPEKHPESPSLDADISYVKHKVECGVDMLITQMFFDNEGFYSYIDRLRKAGVNVPVSAGVMPITKASQIRGMIELSGAAIPTTLSDIIAKYRDDPEDLKKAGLEYARKQVEDLAAHKVDGIHLYSMNKVDVAKAILE